MIFNEVHYKSTQEAIEKINELSFGSFIHVLRVIAKKTQKNIADEINVTNMYISLLESDTYKPTKEKMPHLSKALNVDEKILWEKLEQESKKQRILWETYSQELKKGENE